MPKFSEWVTLYLMSWLGVCINLEVHYEVLPKISKNLNIPRKPLALRTCATRCLLLYLSTISQPTGIVHVFLSFGCFLYTIFMCVC